MKPTIQHRSSKFVVATDGRGIVNHAGAAALAQLADKLGFTATLSEATAGLRRRRSGHDRGEVLRDLVVGIANGGEGVNDVGVLRDQPALFGEVASGSTVQRVVKAIAEHPQGLAMLREARGVARQRAWELGARVQGPLILDIDGTLVYSHSEKEGAAGNYKGGYGFYPLHGFLEGSGEALSGILRPGNAGSNTVADHVKVLELALEQLPAQALGQEILARTDSGGATHGFANACRELEIGFSASYELTDAVCEAILRTPERAWVAALTQEGEPRPRKKAAITELDLDLSDWPPGTRAICRRERPHPGAQLRFTDIHGYRFQVLLTDQQDPDIARLEARHRARAHCEDRIHRAKDTGLRHLPFYRFAHNQLWLELVMMAHDLLGFFAALCLDGPSRLWEPKTLRYRLFHIAARLVCSGRRHLLRLARDWPWRGLVLRAFTRLRALPAT